MKNLNVDQRVADLAIAGCAAEAVSSAEDFFVLTGSYSIEALTGGDVAHNDIDANVFTRDIPRAMASVGMQLGDCNVLPDALQVRNANPNRLEYDVQSPVGRRALELQFVQFSDVQVHDNGIDFTLPGNGDREIVVPTVVRPLSALRGEPVNFLVKSIPFAIATWALRISGVAESQKRPVRQSDIRHFAFLLGSAHDTEEVVQVMERHPQMPDGPDAKAVLATALQQVRG
jgi:hypothetical protein